MDTATCTAAFEPTEVWQIALAQGATVDILDVAEDGWAEEADVFDVRQDRSELQARVRVLRRLPARKHSARRPPQVLQRVVPARALARGPHARVPVRTRGLRKFW